MTRLSAEGDGLRVFISAIAAERTHKEKHETEHQKHEERASAPGIVQVENGVGGYRNIRVLPPPSAFYQCAHQHNKKPEHQNARHENEGDEVGVRVFRSAG